MNRKTCLVNHETMCLLNHNIIKTRDDAHPMCFMYNDDQEYILCEQHIGCSWCESSKTCDEKNLRERIEPWLTALFQSEHLSLLAGSGLTKGICEITHTKATGMPAVNFTEFHDDIEAEVEKSAKAIGRSEGNFEDYIRVASTLLAGLEIIKEPKAKILRAEIDQKIKEFTSSLLKTEAELIGAKPEDRKEAFNCLVSFLMSFASRTGTRDRVNIFTTNYDRLIEEAADLAGLHLLDRFVGKLSPVFRASRLSLDLHYNPPGIRGEPRYLEGVARFTKLHGSLDWVQVGSLIRKIGLPFGAMEITPYLNAPGLEGASEFNLMIYPNSAKDRETAAYPYVELFRDFAAAICRPNSTVVTYGYSFGDEHINRVLQDMLTIPSTHLVIISYDDKMGRIFDFYMQAAHFEQITLLIGPNVAAIDSLTKKYLPKSAIDFATSKMGELLQARWITCSPNEQKLSGMEAKSPLKKGEK